MQLWQWVTPVVQSGGIGVVREGHAIHILHLLPLDGHPNCGLQGLPGGERRLSPDSEAPTQVAICSCACTAYSQTTTTMVLVEAINVLTVLFTLSSTQ